MAKLPSTGRRGAKKPPTVILQAEFSGEPRPDAVFEDDQPAEQGRAPEESSYAPFAPQTLGVYQERFNLLLQQFATPQTNGSARAIVEAELAWAVSQSGAPVAREKYKAALSVLSDLIAQKWSWRVRDHRLELAPADFTARPRTPQDVVRLKEAIRDSMSAECIAQLQVPSTSRFVEEMERPRGRGGLECSILDLVADGVELARDLKQIAHLNGAERQAAVERIIQPYLQLVEGDQVCEHTGYRLIDIWRYFRYSWSLPYFSTPGRNLYYLVRDAARPRHPVIGIAALGNSLIQLGDRDRWIGWSIESLETALRDHAVDPNSLIAFKSTAVERLAVQLDQAIARIDTTGLVTSREITKPSARVIKKLLDRAKASAQQRVAKLQAHEKGLKTNGRRLPQRLRPRDPADTMNASGESGQTRNLADDSVEHLYAQKRATDLAELLRAKMIFQSANSGRDAAMALDCLMSNEDGRRAISAALKAIKKQHVGTSMMDIIICGAIPPYNKLLGGKLVCMLLTSPQVRVDYHRKYSNFPSEIASKMKNAWVARPAELVFLGTTSLYHVGSSQYNRVRVPAEILGGQGEIRFTRLGETRGYGSVHFSDRTRTLLEQVVNQARGATLITRTFGEGVNPKLRLVREGLGCIGLSQDAFLQHRCRRIIYGVALARNSREYLQSVTEEPDYYLPAVGDVAALRSTDAIARYWARRWLSQRIESDDVIGGLSQARRDELRLSRLADHVHESVNGRSPRGEAMVTALNSTGGDSARNGPPPSTGPIGVRFIQTLYNHRSCYADRLSPDQINAIHVATPLEEFVTDTLRSGRDIVLTGNPGDGKTHLIMRLQPTLAAMGVECQVDATAEESYDVILEAWRRARRRKKPFCLAINEWPLLELVKECEDQWSVLKEVRAQVEGGIVYGQERNGSSDSVVVIDLNNRTLVDAAIFEQMVTTLTSDRFYGECKLCPAKDTCDVPKARSALLQDRVRKRLFAVLHLIAKRGKHVTTRDLQGFISFLLAGGRSCEELIGAQSPIPYYVAAFEGDSELFDAIREAFDPARVTHPKYDEALWNGALPSEGWMAVAGVSQPPMAAPGDRLQAMRIAKRRFFFEHSSGDDLLALLPQDELRFLTALETAGTQGERVVRELVRLINRFFDPHDDSDGSLRLWSRHRYDARWSPTYVSVRTVPVDALVCQLPRLSIRTARAYTYQPDHLLLVAIQSGAVVARLRVDLTLYRTLFDAVRGLPVALRSPEVLKRLDGFFNDLGRDLPPLFVQPPELGC